MADNVKAVSIGNTATQIVGLKQKRKVLAFHNNGTETIFLGMDNTVTVNDGFPLLEDAYIVYDLKADPFWGIVASGTQELRVWEDER